MTRVALDSNILAYLAGVVRARTDEVKVEQVRNLIDRLSATAGIVAPAQALGELFIVLRRGGASAVEARAVLMEFAETFGAADTAIRTTLSATDLVVDHQLQYWDALIVSAAVDAGCTLLLSEDMQHGFITRGLTIVNPLTEPTHVRLAVLIEKSAR